MSGLFTILLKMPDWCVDYNTKELMANYLTVDDMLFLRILCYDSIQCIDHDFTGINDHDDYRWLRSDDCVGVII